MLDLILIAFIILYFSLVIGSVFTMALAWYRDHKVSKKRAGIKIVRNEDE